jgi:WD40 repeat protein
MCSVQYSHGARLGDCRKLLRYNEDGRAVYVVSTLAVIADRNNVAQLYYSGHRDAIISLDLDSSGKIAATGELAPTPALHVWDAKTGRGIKVFEQLHRQGISSVSFSANAEYLVSLGQDVHNSIAICHSPSKKWHDGHHICSTAVSSAKMLWCLHSTSSTTFPIVVGGAAGNVYFFRVVRGAAERVKGVYGKRHKIQPMLCAIDGVITGTAVVSAAPVVETDEPAPPPLPALATPGSMKAAAANALLGSPAASTVTSMNVMLCGTVSGYIYVYADCKVMNRVPAHEAPINALSTSGKRFLSAGKEGKVKLWSSDLKQLMVFNTNTYLPRPFLMACHALCGNRQSTSFLVGMRSGEVFEVSLQSYTYALLSEGHSRGELHALDINPAVPDEYATAGDDGVVMVWSLSKRYCLRKVRVEAASRALAYSPDGTLIAIGFGAGEGHAMASKDGKSFTAALFLDTDGVC